MIHALPIHVLLIEDNPAAARLIEEILAATGRDQFQLTHAARLAAGLEALARAAADIVLLDLTLPDSEGLDTFVQVRQAAPQVPIIILSGLADEALAVRTVQEGAQDYLVKGQTDGALLARAIRYAIERQRGEARLAAKQHRLQSLNADLVRSKQELTATLADLRRSHEELQAAQLQLIQAEKMESIGRLAAGVAHEVKNPLAIVLMGIEYLAETSSPDDKTLWTVLGEMRAAVERADRIVRGLLDFSGPGRLEQQPEDFNAVLGSALLLLRHELRQHHVKVVKQLAPGLPLVPMDRTKIEQVFVNLFLNAVNAMPHGGELRIQTAADGAARPGRRGAVRADVEDTGTGIPPDKLPHVFEPFVTTKPGTGSGLGLAVAKSIIELHGGRIDLANRPQGGVCATVQLAAETRSES